MSKAILITGATGKQGGSVVNNLVSQDANVEILAVTRDVTSTSAQKLEKKSPKIKLVQGNLDQPDEIFANAKKVTSQPIWGVFSVQVPSLNGKHEIEERQGKALVDAALKNNVKHFVYTSVDRGGDVSLENPTVIPHFISKHNIELHLINSTKGTDMSWAILRPVAFLDGSFVPGFIGKIFATCWKIALKEKPLQVIAVSDIGFFGAQAFLKPDEYKEQGISLAGDELSFDEMTRIFKSKTGKDVPLTFEFVAWFFMWMIKDFGTMFQWFHDEGYKTEIQALKKAHPGLKDFRAWLETESDWK
ncbi:hypothetical protein BDW59DRAFT_143083 [Aspergillus cavernicola]|uniref:NmrA-like domain-containing protein n=1 Tax=Aspergillus cavernicola TaxID=176166 RepID=A0ABR4IL24_9EURO